MRAEPVMTSCDSRPELDEVMALKRELPKCTSHTALLRRLQCSICASGCSSRAGAARVHFAYCACIYQLRLSSRSCQIVLRVLRLSCKVGTFKPELSHPGARGFRAGAAARRLARCACIQKGNCSLGAGDAQVSKCTSCTSLVPKRCDF